MNDQQLPTWEQSIAALAREYPYPSTPDVAASVRTPVKVKPLPVVQHRRAPSWAVALAVIVTVLALGVLAVPQTRAAVWSLVVRIGAIRVFVDEPAATTTTPAAELVPSSAATPAEPTPVPLALLAAVPGERVDIESLQSFAAFPLRLPSSSGPWRSPDSAVVHPVGNSQMVTFVWDDPQRPGQPFLTFSQTDIPQLAFKMAGADQMTVVQLGTGEALWIEGPHTIQLPIDGSRAQIGIASNVLVWSDDVMTYRIEGAVTQTEAIRLANSLPDMPVR